MVFFAFILFSYFAFSLLWEKWEKKVVAVFKEEKTGSEKPENKKQKYRDC